MTRMMVDCRATPSESRCWAVLVADRDRADTYVQIVEFPSYQEAIANSDHPATKALAEQLGKLSTGEMTYRNLDVLEVESDV